MDYEFRRDISGQAQARFSMEHLAIGRWFTEELNTPTKAETLLTKLHAIEQAKETEYYQAGFELSLSIRHDGVSVSPKTNEGWDERDTYLGYMDLDDEHQAGDNTELYQQESNAECGMLDFKEALSAWLSYIQDSS